MNRITEEDAERIPQRLSMRKHLNKVNYLRYRENTRICVIHPYNYMDKLIAKYVGKKWDDCYSEFRKWLRVNKKLRKESTWIINGFKKKFTNFESARYSYRYTYADYSINQDGIIIKVAEERKCNIPIIYKEYKYVYINKFNSLTYDVCNFIHDFGREFYNKCVKGLTEKEFFQLTADNGPGHRNSIQHTLVWRLTKVGIGEPLTDKNEITKALKEREALKRKCQREFQLSRKQAIDAEIIKSFATTRERKKAAKRHQQWEAKQEEAFNAIERDRLGFDETSFKTPQKFTNND